MLHSLPSSRLIGIVAVLGVLAGCAPNPNARPPLAAATTNEPEPELAGAWYEIYFDSGSQVLNNRGLRIVDRAALVVANAGPTRVTVIGRTDRVGLPPENMALARQRAEAVRAALVSAGVPEGIITTSWTGERKQAVATYDDEAEPMNRVVDVKVIKTSP